MLGSCYSVRNQTIVEVILKLYPWMVFWDTQNFCKASVMCLFNISCGMKVCDSIFLITLHNKFMKTDSENFSWFVCIISQPMPALIQFKAAITSSRLEQNVLHLYFGFLLVSIPTVWNSESIRTFANYSSKIMFISFGLVFTSMHSLLGCELPPILRTSLQSLLLLLQDNFL